MRVAIDTKKCLSNGLCESMAPTVFEVGDDDLAHALQNPVAVADHAATRQAARMCPVGAITLEDIESDEQGLST